MPMLHWSVPVAGWATWPEFDAAPAEMPRLAFMDPLLRRRLSSLSKMALHVAYQCAQARPQVKLVFASQHGELQRTQAILDQMLTDEPISPNAFSLSVLNTMAGIFGIARGDRTPATALSSGAETLGYGLLEASTQFQADALEPAPGVPILLVYADEPPPPHFGTTVPRPPAAALALLLEAGASHVLECSLQTAPAALPQGATEPAHIEGRAPTAGFASQCDALLHCLAGRGDATWLSHSSRWCWHARAA